MAPDILLVDDDETIREFISEALSDEGYTIITASQGAAALVLARDHDLKLILLDMRMPIMDGYAFLEAYCRTPEPHAPVVVLTALSEDINTALPPEVIALLAKPFELVELIALVEQLIQK